MTRRSRSPKVFTIPAAVSFADALAASLVARSGEDPAALARTRILLPNRRSVRVTTEAFLRVRGGRPLLLPRMHAIGDVSDDELVLFGDAGDALDLPPAIPEIRRSFLLARLIMRRARGTAVSPAAAYRLAGELARLIDSVHTEGLSFDRLNELVPEELAAHWQATLDFLSIITTHWPAILAEEGVIDPADRRNRLLRALARRWQEAPPGTEIIAAGTTGSIPATAELLDIVARLPQGSVILPGLHGEMDEESWQALGPEHPQFTMRQLLERIGVSRHEVAPWPLPKPWRAIAEARKPRIALLQEALRPAATVARWSAYEGDAAAATAGFRRIDCPGLREEAGAIALLMRETLETPGKTAALVTPDRALARQVAAELARWGIAVDDSAGRPAGTTFQGSFLRLLLTTTLEGFAPVSLLALLKHPLTGGGRRPGEVRRLARFLDRFAGREGYALRGPAPAPGMDGLLAALAAAGVPSSRVGEVETLLRPLGPLEAALAADSMPLADLLQRHLEAAEALAATHDLPGPARLWQGEAGEALADLLSEAAAEAESAGTIPGTAYPALFDALLEPLAVRPRYGRHPRLAILGTIEARLFHADLMVLGGLNEGTWPPAAAHDPWMSRAMRERFGLPSPDRRTGQAAHDFVQCAGAAELVLTRSTKRDGTPTVPSRWLSRLEVLAPHAARGGERYLALVRQIDMPETVKSCAPPRPTPPVEARPRRLSVTQVETWMRDPYAIYARHILRLRPLDPLEDDPGALSRGTVMHEALDRFLRERPEGEDCKTARARLLACGRDAFGALLDRPAVRAFWWPRFEAVADAFLDLEDERACLFKTVATEVTGALDLPAPHTFTLTAKADRIDRRREDGMLEIIDYKTGSPPSNRRIEAGFAPQLPLEGWMAEEGAFEKIPAATVDGLAFWQLRGTRVPIDIRTIPETARQIIAARQGLLRLVERFARAGTPYLSNPRPPEAGWGDYDHLARVEEWTTLPNLPETDE